MTLTINTVRRLGYDNIASIQRFKNEYMAHNPN